MYITRYSFSEDHSSQDLHNLAMWFQGNRFSNETQPYLKMDNSLTQYLKIASIKDAPCQEWCKLAQ